MSESKLRSLLPYAQSILRIVALFLAEVGVLDFGVFIFFFPTSL